MNINTYIKRSQVADSVANMVNEDGVFPRRVTPTYRSRKSYRGGPVWHEMQFDGVTTETVWITKAGGTYRIAEGSK